MREAVDIFSGRYVLLVSDDKERTLLLARSLQQSKAKVGVRRADCPAPPAGTELVLVDVRHGPLNEAEKALLGEPRLRLASVCAVDFRSIVTERGSVRMGLLEDMVFPLIARDSALAEQARRELTFACELASLGPVRTLRALCRAGETLQVVIEAPDPPAIHGTVTLSGELVVSAFLSSDTWHEEGLPAFARLIDLRHGKLSVSRITHPPVMNIMEPLDVALAHAQGRATTSDRPSQQDLRGLPDATVHDDMIDDDVPVLLLRRRLPGVAPDPISVSDILALEVEAPSEEPEITQIVHSCELLLDAPPAMIEPEVVAAPPSPEVTQTEKRPPIALLPVNASPSADAPFAGPRSELRLPTPVLRSAPKRSMFFSATLGLAMALGGGWLFLDRQTPAALPAVEQLMRGGTEEHAEPEASENAGPGTTASQPVHDVPSAPSTLATSASQVMQANAADPPRDPPEDLGASVSAEVARAEAAATSSKDLVDLATKLLVENPQAAKRLFDAAVARDVRNPHAHAGLGQALLVLEQPEEAQKALEVAVKLRAKRASYRILLGDALHMAGKVDEARAAWRKARDLDPEDDTARDRLRSIEATHG